MLSFEQRMNEYLPLLANSLFPLGNWRNGEIEIIDDIEVIRRFEEERCVNVINGTYNGKPGSHFQIGILVQDQYLISVRDLVLFPPKSGTEPILGTYRRLIYPYDLTRNPSVCILPIDTQKNIILSLAFRHALRNFTCEAPGTIAKEGEDIFQAMNRCIRFELGRPIIETHLLSNTFLSERGFFGSLVPMYLAVVGQQDEMFQDPSIQGHITITSNEFEWHLQQGSINVMGRSHNFNDSYTNTAYLLAKLKKLI